MPRTYGAINADLPALLPAIKAAGYQIHQFGTFAWDERDKPEEPPRQFVQVTRAGPKGAVKHYALADGDWLPRALANIAAMEFGKP